MGYVSPSGASAEHNTNTASDLTHAEKDEFIKISSHTTLKSKYHDTTVDSFWISLKNEYPETIRLWILYLPFSTLHLCMAAFSTLETMKSQNWLTLCDVDSEMFTSLPFALVLKNYVNYTSPTHPLDETGSKYMYYSH
ncbi:hypothetical protein Cfor_04038 [Coptotermes formosanus]|jgi:hypothetical protein|uniref:Uncharacterized protein n=1 Tax=Coptotermes formosanus TaxID=36987 RepID=A0A6L2PHM8_COPFO|nr:hypothetical protein Cfor_04038 [Coptotermes formosanus]